MQQHTRQSKITFTSAQCLCFGFCFALYVFGCLWGSKCAVILCERGIRDITFKCVSFMGIKLKMPSTPENKTQLNKRADILFRWEHSCFNKEKAATRNHQMWYNKRQRRM